MDHEASTNPILWRLDERGVAYVTLNRPQVYNAYNGEMITALVNPVPPPKQTPCTSATTPQFLS